MPYSAGSARNSEIDELERLAIELADGAAALVRRRRQAGSPLDVSFKSTDTDPVTEADRGAERWLVDRLHDQRPRDGVLAEEGSDWRGDSGVRWVLDPLDGTVNFVLGIPQYAVSVAAEADGVVVAAAVCNAATGELFHARLGGGSFRDGQRLSGPRDRITGQAVVGTGFGYTAERRARQARVVAELLPRIADIRRIGSASLDLCAVAGGHLDAYFEAGLQPWDYAAGLLIAREAGALASGLRGQEPSGTFLAVAGTRLAAPLFALLEELDADRVTQG